VSLSIKKKDMSTKYTHCAKTLQVKKWKISVMSTDSCFF